MVLPRVTVALARANMGIAPWDANPYEANLAARGVSGASDESAGRKKRRTKRVNFSPWVVAPENNLAASGGDRVAVIRAGTNNVTIRRQCVRVTFGNTDYVAAQSAKALDEKRTPFRRAGSPLGATANSC